MALVRWFVHYKNIMNSTLKELLVCLNILAQNLTDGAKRLQTEAACKI